MTGRRHVIPGDGAAAFLLHSTGAADVPPGRHGGRPSPTRRSFRPARASPQTPCSPAGTEWSRPRVRCYVTIPESPGRMHLDKRRERDQPILEWQQMNSPRKSRLERHSPSRHLLAPSSPNPGRAGAGGLVQPAPADEKQSPQAWVNWRGDDAQQVDSLTKTINQLKSAGRFAEAVEPARKVLATVEKALDPDHWQTADARRPCEESADIADLPEEGARRLRPSGELARRPRLNTSVDISPKQNELAASDGDSPEMAGRSPPRDRRRLQVRCVLPDCAGEVRRGRAPLSQALAIRLKALGEDHPETATSYNNLAYDPQHQGKSPRPSPSAARPWPSGSRRSGRTTPIPPAATTTSRPTWMDSGSTAEAESSTAKALAIRLKGWGRTIPTPPSLQRPRGRPGCTGEVHQRRSRTGRPPPPSTSAPAVRQSASGVERSFSPLRSPLPALAVALARQNRPREAWARWESDLARGLLDDFSARLLRPLTLDHHRREADLAGQLQRFDERITRLAVKARRTQVEDRQLDALRNDRAYSTAQWVEFQNALDHSIKLTPASPRRLEGVQKALPADAALVGWLDLRAIIGPARRREGDPTWVNVLARVPTTPGPRRTSSGPRSGASLSRTGFQR